MKINIQYSPRRRRIALRINREGCLEVMAPAGLSEETVLQLLHQNESVIEKLMNRAAAARKMPQISDAVSMLYLGKTYPLFTSLRLLQFDGERFMVPSGTDEERLDGLEKIYRKLAAHHIIPRVQMLADSFKLSVGKIRINGAVTRWGSCSGRGDLNFSWHLIRCPEELIDSVICHELAHRLELNHSARFYCQLAKMDPQYAEHRLALRRFIRCNPWFR